MKQEINTYTTRNQGLDYLKFIWPFWEENSPTFSLETFYSSAFPMFCSVTCFTKPSPPQKAVHAFCSRFCLYSQP